MNSRAAKNQRTKAATNTAQQGKRDQRTWWVFGVVVAVVVVALVVSQVGGSEPSADEVSRYGRKTATADLVDQVTGIPANVIEQVGRGDAAFPTITGTPSSDAKPTVLFIGAEFCPYCAAERWSIVNALARFGTFTGLTTTRSSHTDVHPDTATFSFLESEFTSKYVTFDAVEIASNEPNDNGIGYRELETATDQQAAEWKKHSPQGGVPFASIGGQFVITGPSFDTALLKGLSLAQIARAMADPESAVARGALGAANVITAAVCEATNGMPDAVCGTAAITAIRSELLGG